MNKRVVRIIGGLIFLLVLIFIMILVYDNQLHKQENLNSPGLISSYWDWEQNYYKIDPETILASLERGDANIFTPLLEDPQEIEELTNISIYWTQADFLKIASALGQIVWDDPMDLKDWSVYDISFEGSCEKPIGFDFAKITYFKTGSKRYTTRLIEIHPYFGWVRWGGGKTYPQPILRKWNSVDLIGSNITADDAVQIASADVKERFLFKNQCGVIIGSPENNDHKNWYLHIFGAPDFIAYIVNLDTGDYTFQKLNK